MRVYSSCLASSAKQAIRGLGAENELPRARGRQRKGVWKDRKCYGHKLRGRGLFLFSSQIFLL